MKRFEGKVVIVTGAASGIGEATDHGIDANQQRAVAQGDGHRS
jgi:NADP-dependent 3-hydroxy acid dehydrogenase YdfG